LVWVDGQLAVVRPPYHQTRGSTTYILECSATDASGNRGSARLSDTTGGQDGGYNWDHQH